MSMEAKGSKMVDITIDGSQGEGGGQILRTSLSLAVCLNKSITVKNIRAGRKKPGLLRQHLACVRAAAEICGARVTGDTLGSDAIEFYPGPIKAGQYAFSVGSAGSTTLIFQTIFMPLLMAKGCNEVSCSEVSFSGGTHNPMAPSFDFLAQSFLTVMQSLGIQVDTQLLEYGFAPAGGGRWHAKIHPGKPHALKASQLTEQVPQANAISATAIVSRLAQSIAQRELDEAAKQLNLEPAQLQYKVLKAPGPGNMVSIAVDSGINNLFEVPGEKRITAERIAQRAAKRAKYHIASGAMVEEHLTDQLLLPLAVGNGGTFTSSKVSLHTQTNIDVIQQFLDVTINVKQLSDNCWQIAVEP